MNHYIFPSRLLVLIVIFSMLTSCAQATITNQPPIPIPSLTSIPLTIELPSPTPEIKSSPANANPIWEIKEDWSAANQIRAMLIDQNGDLWTGGPAGVVHWDLKTNTPTVYAIKGNPENTNVLGLSQTPDGSIWVGTYGNGLAKFDGNTWQTLTKKDGLPGDFIISQTVTSKGELWLVILGERQEISSGHFGRLNDTHWFQENGGAFDHIIALPDDSIISIYNYPYHGGFFDSTVARYDGQKWNKLEVEPDRWIDAVTVAPNGMIWFTTLDKVYQDVNQKATEIIPPWSNEYYDYPISSIAVSDDGVTWFAFSFHTGFDLDQCGYHQNQRDEFGVYRYDGNTWIHFTSEDGLINNKICSIAIDQNNNVWFGSYDKGISRFDGTTWTSYVVP